MFSVTLSTAAKKKKKREEKEENISVLWQNERRVSNRRILGLNQESRMVMPRYRLGLRAGG